MSFSRLLTAGLFLLSFCAKSEPLYWLASKGNNSFMLIGSIHLGDESMYPLPTPLTKFLKNSDGLIVEADLSDSNDVIYPTAPITTKEVLDETQQEQLADIAEQLQVDVSRLNLSAPWAAAITLQVSQMQQLGYQSNLGIDQYLIKQAQNLTIPIFGLETLQYQIDLLAGLDNGGADLLTSTLDSWGDASQQLPCLFESWNAGDKQALMAVAEASQMPDEVAQKLAIERNKNWLKRLEDKTFLPRDGGQYVIAVGALHLIGEESLIALMKENGYQIKQLNHTTSVSCAKTK